MEEQNIKEQQEQVNKTSSEEENIEENTAQDNNKDSQDTNQALKELEEKYLRVHADFENYKKRLERDKNQALEYAYEKITKDLLPILDALENAKEAAKEHTAIAEGITHTKDNLLKVLNKHGVQEVEAFGEFDPNLHECIMQVANPEIQDGHIAQVMQKGYKYKERTLRPAMVAVAKNN